MTMNFSALSEILTASSVYDIEGSGGAKTLILVDSTRVSPEWFAEFREMLTIGGFEVTVILTPTPDLAIRVLESGLKKKERVN